MVDSCGVADSVVIRFGGAVFPVVVRRASDLRGGKKRFGGPVFAKSGFSEGEGSDEDDNL